MVTSAVEEEVVVVVVEPGEDILIILISRICCCRICHHYHHRHHYHRHHHHHHCDAHLVVAVRYQVRADLGQCERQPRVRLGRGGEGGDLHVEILAQVRVLRVRRGAQLLLLRQSEVGTEVT